MNQVLPEPGPKPSKDIIMYVCMHKYYSFCIELAYKNIKIKERQTLI